MGSLSGSTQYGHQLGFWKDSAIFKDHWEIDHAPISIWATQLDLVYFFWGKRFKSGSMDLGVMESECDCDTFMEFQIMNKSTIFGRKVKGQVTIWGVERVKWEIGGG